MNNNREEFQKIFDKAKDAREELKDIISDSVEYPGNKSLNERLDRVCELFFSAGQKNNF